MSWKEISSLAIIKSTTTDSWQIHYKMMNDCSSSEHRIVHNIPASLQLKMLQPYNQDDSRAQQLCGISWSHFSLTAARRSWQISCLTAKQLTGSPPVPLFALTETLCLSSTRDRQFIAPSFEECYYFPIFSHTKIRIFSRIRFRFKFIDPACR